MSWTPLDLQFAFFIIFFNRIYSCQSDIQNELPFWSWECVNEKCIPSRVLETDKLQSLATCNMLCSLIQIWPQPTGSVSLATSAVPVRADLFRLILVTVPSRSVRDHLQKAFDILKNDLGRMEHKDRGLASWYSVTVRVTVKGSGDPRMRVDTDESYQLSLRPKIGTAVMYADIVAYSFCGARHGLETLSQLIWYDPVASSLLVLEAAKVEDSPRFKYRGLLIDTARNYFPISDLLRTVDAMAASKLNTFHWHVSDSQSFSLKLNKVPQLSQWGAYSSRDTYTTDEVRVLVRRARLRGIRVLIEINTPARIGSAWNWGFPAGLGNISLCGDAEPWSAYCSDAPCDQLNPRNPHAYNVLEQIYTEILLLTGVDDMIHLGNDEISKYCWSQHFSDTDPMELWLEFMRKALKRVENAYGRLPNVTLIWSSNLNERIKCDLKEYVHILGLQIRSAAWAHKSVTGLQTVFSHEDAWDLNDGMGVWHKDSVGAPYNSWQRIYEHRPWIRNDAYHILGGEATVWSLALAEDSLDAHIWPRAAAFAERLWTDRAEGATQPVHARLDFHVTRLASRGVNAAPLWSLWCTQNTHTCS